MGRYQKIKEPIEVLVSFKKEKPRPHFFRWRGKKYEIQEITLVHKERKDGSFKWLFSCFDGANYFKLRFSPNELSWSLEELYCEEG